LYDEKKKGGKIMFAPKNILVPTDFSKYADAALKKAVDIATQHDTKIYLLHVIDKQIVECVVDYCLSYEVVEALKKDSLKEGKAKLQKEAEAIVKSKKIKVSYDIKSVMSSHGKTGLLKQLMGSVADKVVQGSKCPVLVIKP
jgi:nucleotide-binding universal stress UspA family protein